jgi:hypothetical protein
MENSEKCGICDTPIPPVGTACDVCQTPIGFPNVRLANKESALLGKRYLMEMESVKARSIQKVAHNFEIAVDTANVVMVRSFIDLIAIVENENKLISTFHQQVASGARLAENNAFDSMRDAIESIVHPLYYDKIHCAALSLNLIGVKTYGDTHIKLNDKYIQNRTSFFEENPFNLVKKLKLAAGETLPSGYRASWVERGKLALCKYHANLKGDETRLDDFQNILLVQQDDPDFIEAHIYGSIHMKCIEAVTLQDDASNTAKVLFDAKKKSFLMKGIQVEVRQS